MIKKIIKNWLQIKPGSLIIANLREYVIKRIKKIKGNNRNMIIILIIKKLIISRAFDYIWILFDWITK